VICLLRHGDAEDGDREDALRLTTKGERQASAAGPTLAVLGAKIETCRSDRRRRPLVAPLRPADLAAIAR
jgi:phosphohistidine phosphatase SixA